MTKLEDFIIQEPYLPTEEEKLAVQELVDKGLIAADWDSRKKYVMNFKKNLRKDIYEKQNKLCAYCRIHVPAACVPMPIEHIVYKDNYPQWMFLPENLCIACPTCNIYKGATDVLTNPQIRTYPITSDGFKIIHPLYDRYSDHIELIGGILYRGKTSKGKFTIKTCHLYRVELAEERVDQKMYYQHKSNIIVELIYLSMYFNQYVDDEKKLLQKVKAIVKEYKQDHAKER